MHVSIKPARPGNKTAMKGDNAKAPALATNGNAIRLL